ncbi:hypothetical protein QCA50_002482 [Cerrena zonata]|uniref:Homeobox domain-containing protein n=1 Tax=Cerrena zonata TaxID=2478898 RepID=A0AAW0GY21_9APHY
MRPQTRSTRNIRPLIEESALHSVPATTLKRPRLESTFEVYRDEDSGPNKKKSRHRMTDLQLERLETLYQYATHPTRQEKEDLGHEVGMDGRTVTVWFQNRRQLAKKASDAEVVAKRYGNQLPTQRQPLAVVRTVANRQTSKPPATLSSDSSSHIILQPTPILAQPIVNQTFTSFYPKPLPTEKPIKRVTRPMESRPERTQVFEWKPYQRGMNDLDNSTNSSDGDTTDEDIDILNTDDDDILPQPPVQTNIKDIQIPAELRSRFSDDVVLGASLLLSFQNSAL